MHRMVPIRMGNFGKTELSYLLSGAGVASAQSVAVEIIMDCFANRAAGP